MPEKFSNIIGEIGFGVSFKAILLSGISSLACDIDEKIIKQKRKDKSFIILIFISIGNDNLTHEKQK